MLLNVNTKTGFAERIRTQRLQFFGFDERALQDVLFKSLDRLFPDDELVLLMQSRYWQEEPDLMAVDKNGHLYIFELKAWESHPSNLLQVLRYGQIFGNSKYSDLDTWYKKTTDQSQSLANSHSAKFDVVLRDEDYNGKQVFVVITNGLDYRTREAIQYWRTCGLDIRPWVYRAYPGKQDEMLLEIAPFRVEDNPYEDIAEGYYILNTNISNGQADHDDMLNNKKAAAYFDPWKFKIERLAKGDVIFLFQSRVGIVALGEADGRLGKAAYQGNPSHPDEEYFMKLNSFQKVSPPLTTAEIKAITGINHVFMSTMFGLDADSGKAIRKSLHDSNRLIG
ncbi:hypothetical protein U5801_15695 [Lamprobacter modestohalophilus]|uniref:hypothetical protein n=1 Tax=Lamprobacter modestohalophilus TaxID=1064514 RepID=UPI002ADEECA9|nr:hypothetical protein [Lamprobacter modestohalophilus]MEA1051237.1 hypothetical protein [Lamprobacter modestohalophilus]